LSIRRKRVSHRHRAIRYRNLMLGQLALLFLQIAEAQLRNRKKLFPPFKDEGELIASWGQAQLVKHLDGKVELKGWSKEDRLAPHEWISLFGQETVVRES
jgi:hypothetical protein